ncbi:M28 family peptidase [Rhodothermus profundi]|uniref:Peptidase family M28 n=1 Tax=Rhodothermus profundi TaxID=633813 RepID=A0A1M6Q8W1_9BACT|nr:M28 family peptidase [Rhodothermus profundi]SHK16537.1 Peptidase family M28 [Rhodothermus profundi]
MYRLLPILGLTIGVATCAPAPRPPAEERIQFHEPDDPLLLAEHLDVLLQPAMRERVTGSRSFALAARYVADRMREFRLQPALAGRYQLVYEARVHLPWPVTLGWADRDTAAFYPGLEFWPDARSDTGRVVADRVALCAVPDGCPSAPVWLLPAAFAKKVPAVARAQGVQAVLLVGPLRPELAHAPIANLKILQLTPNAAGRLLGLSPSTLTAHLTGAEAVALRLRRPLRLRVQRLDETQVGALNVLGFVAGKDPLLRAELVIVCADLDAIALPGTSLLFDGAHLGEGVAALLELARFYSTLATYWPLPQRTVLFAVWSGARQGYQGLQAYLRQPLWELNATQRIIYLDPDPATLPHLQELVAAYGLTLKPVLLPDSVQVERQVFWNVPSGWQQAYQRIYRTSPAVSPPDPEALRVRALQRARMLVRAAQATLLSEVILPEPWEPVREDTLPLPALEHRP